MRRVCNKCLLDENHPLGFVSTMMGYVAAVIRISSVNLND